jgi:hypothetical protein
MTITKIEQVFHSIRRPGGYNCPTMLHHLEGSSDR